MKQFRVPLRVVFYKEDGRLIAHCLEFDLCGDGRSHQEALASLSEAISIQVRESLEHDNLHNLISPAPSEIQERFFAGRQTARGELQLAIEARNLIEIEAPEYREYSEDPDLLATP